MPEPSSFDYAIVRVVPQVEREEFLNAGVVVFSVREDFLAARVELDEARLKALAPDADVELILSHLQAIPKICAGGPEAGPIGQLSRKERWHWLVAPRSTVLQTSPVHSGICESAQRMLDQIFARMVAPPAR